MNKYPDNRHLNLIIGIDRQYAAFISILTLLTFSGCSGLTAVHIPGHWHQEGISKKDTQTRFAKCTYDVGMNKVNSVQESRLINACMEGEGFRWIPPRIEYR